MTPEEHFNDPGLPTLNAAQIGIYRERWTVVSPDHTEAEVQALMAKHQFDVVPLVENGKVEKYYQTVQYGDFSKIQLCEIQAADKIYYLTQFEDLIELFFAQNRHFFFLWDHQNILGLVSSVNLVSTPVFAFIYQQTSALERTISQMFKWVYTDEEQLKQMLLDNANKIQDAKERSAEINYLEKLFTRHEKEKVDNEHQHLLEQLSLKDLLGILRKQKWLSEFGYKNQPFKQKIKIIKDIRNIISHPVRASLKIEHLRYFSQDIQKLTAAVAQAELQVHYRLTDYCVDNFSTPIQIGQELAAELKAHCSKQAGWCYITAYNPHSQPLDPKLNRLLNEKLQEELTQLNYQVFRGKGVSTTDHSYPGEESFWVPGIERDVALELGRKYGQNAIVWGKRDTTAELVLCAETANLA